MEILIKNPIKINDRLLEVVNDYENIECSYKEKTSDELCMDPLSSIENFPLTQCFYRVSIIIAIWNSVSALKCTLKSLSHSNIINRFNSMVEVVVVDDGSEENVKEMIISMSLPYKLKYIRQPHLGRAQAVNLAIYKAIGDIIVFCDADIVISPVAIDELIKRQQLFLNDAIFFGFRQDISIEQAQPLFSGNSKQMEFDFYKDNRFLTDYPEGWGNNMMLETNMLRGRKCTKNIYVANETESIEDCWQLFRMVYGFLFSVSRENIIKIGGFAEYLQGWGFDDTEVVAKCMLNGVVIVPTPSAFVYHIQHGIRTQTQWKDGAENEIRVMNHLKSLEFENYINASLDNRVLEYVELEAKGNCELRNDIVISFAQKEAEYHYALGNLKNAIELYANIGIRGLLNDKEYDNFVDAIIRTNDIQLFREFVAKDKTHKHGYYHNLAMFLFLGEQNKPFNDKEISFAVQIGKEKLLERFEKYANEKQWLLALKDCFGALCVAPDDYELIRLCEKCREELQKQI